LIYTGNGWFISLLPASSCKWIVFYRSPEFAMTAPQVAQQVTPQVRKMLEACLEACIKPCSRGKIQETPQLSDRENVRKVYIRAALNAGWLAMTIPGKPNSRFQKYVITESGKKAIKAIRKPQ
jgi:hypothetical protein